MSRIDPDNVLEPENVTPDLTPGAAARELRIGRTALLKLVLAEELFAYKAGKRLRITRKSLDAYKVRHRFMPTEEDAA
ncbi:helix-turn-helix domain-containing protein [Ruegeria arenilitoris]|uniref:helix-turn-helix domain-containing protein n=1 Tax=Ruegeria arenilitoris TaxID=1173585 RepID=UPI001479FC19|nr:helix-turn-helix domain-containing protein [Ruegeria arenilitoris]